MLQRPKSAPKDASFETETLNDFLRAAGQGDETAFSELVHHVAPRLKTWLMRRNYSDSDAEDIIQETFVALWQQAAARFDPLRSNIYTFIVGIARHKAADRWRMRNAAVNNAAFVPLDDVADTLQSDAGENVDALAVRQALKLLPAEQYQCVYAMFYQGLTHEQLAANSGIPLGTVKSRLRLAYSSLRKNLG
jgi:RNA polymerase sigma-70 factor (ECF subfamily)